VAFNLKKGSLPIRGDIDLAAANDCMKKGLEILAGQSGADGRQVWSPDIVKQNEDLMVEFWKTDMSAGRRSEALGRNPRKRQLSTQARSADCHPV
jgi:hypothetical protein